MVQPNAPTNQKPFIVQPLPAVAAAKQGCFAWLFSSAWRMARAICLVLLAIAAWQRYVVPVWFADAPIVSPVATPSPTLTLPREGTNSPLGDGGAVQPKINIIEPPAIPAPTPTPFVPNLQIGAMIVSSDIAGRTYATAATVGFLVSPGRGDTTILDVDGDTLRCNAVPASVADLERCEQMVAAAESADLPNSTGVYTNTYSSGRVFRCTNVLKSASGIDRCQEVIN